MYMKKPDKTPSNPLAAQIEELIYSHGLNPNQVETLTTLNGQRLDRSNISNCLYKDKTITPDFLKRLSSVSELNTSYTDLIKLWMAHNPEIPDELAEKYLSDEPPQQSELVVDIDKLEELVVKHLSPEKIAELLKKAKKNA